MLADRQRIRTMLIEGESSGPGTKQMKAKAKVLTTASAILVLAALMLAVAPDDIARGQTPEKVTVRFTWKLKGEYAPLYVALQKGYYNAEGLDVQLAEGNGAQNVLKALASGNEKFGYGPAVAAARAVSQGLPVKVVALYQTSAPMAVIAFPDTPLKAPKDIEGKRLAISVGETFGDMIRPFTRINNIDLSKVQLIQMEAAKIMASYMAVPEQPDVLEQQVEATMVTTNAPPDKPIGWQAEADWRANLDLLKETGDIDEIKPLNSYFTNAYLQ